MASDGTFQIEHRRDIAHCPGCGQETDHEIVDGTYHVVCPDHGEVVVR